MYPMQFMLIFGSASCVRQLIIPEQLNQIYIVAHRWTEEILSFPTMCHSSKSVTLDVWAKINTISPISIDKSTLTLGFTVP